MKIDFLSRHTRNIQEDLKRMQTESFLTRLCAWLLTREWLVGRMFMYHHKVERAIGHIGVKVDFQTDRCSELDLWVALKIIFIVNLLRPFVVMEYYKNEISISYSSNGVWLVHSPWLYMPNKIWIDTDKTEAPTWMFKLLSLTGAKVIGATSHRFESGLGEYDYGEYFCVGAENVYIFNPLKNIMYVNLPDNKIAQIPFSLTWRKNEYVREYKGEFTHN